MATEHEAMEKLVALSAEENQCWVFRTDAEVDGVDISCLRLIGGRVDSAGGPWTEEMCCLPCRLRAIVSELHKPAGKCFIIPGVHEPGCKLYNIETYTRAYKEKSEQSSTTE